MIFLFPRLDMLVPWRVITKSSSSSPSLKKVVETNNLQTLHTPAKRAAPASRPSTLWPGNPRNPECWKVLGGWIGSPGGFESILICIHNIIFVHFALFVAAKEVVVERWSDDIPNSLRWSVKASLWRFFLIGFSPVKACSAWASCQAVSAVRNCSRCLGSIKNPPAATSWRRYLLLKPCNHIEFHHPHQGS